MRGDVGSTRGHMSISTETTSTPYPQHTTETTEIEFSTYLSPDTTQEAGKNPQNIIHAKQIKEFLTQLNTNNIV